MGGQECVGFLPSRPETPSWLSGKMLILKFPRFDFHAMLKPNSLRVEKWSSLLFLVVDKGLFLNVNTLNKQTGGDDPSTPTKPWTHTYIYTLTHMPDKRMQTETFPLTEQINKLLIREGKCDWPVTGGAMIYCTCHRHLTVTFTPGLWDRSKYRLAYVKTDRFSTTQRAVKMSICSVSSLLNADMSIRLMEKRKHWSEGN